jgi:hypothetical protein
MGNAAGDATPRLVSVRGGRQVSEDQGQKGRAASTVGAAFFCVRGDGGRVLAAGHSAPSALNPLKTGCCFAKQRKHNMLHVFRLLAAIRCDNFGVSRKSM